MRVPHARRVVVFPARVGPAVIIMAMQQAAIMAIAIVSDSTGKQSEIEVLTGRINSLTSAVDFWNRWMLWGLVVAALAAVWVVVTTRLTIVRSKELSVVQDLLDSAKDRQYQEESKSKDLKIGEATQTAEEARERSARLENENLRLQERISVQGHRNLQILESQGQFSDSLKRFAGQRFEIGICPEFVHDWEVFEFRTTLEYTLSGKSEWASRGLRDVYVCSTGIGVYARSTSPPSTLEAAKALALELDKLLGRHTIGATQAGQVGLTLTPPPVPPTTIGVESSDQDTILIVVGAHP
jgi:hypothetical protein